jgi:hypothetical protein
MTDLLTALQSAERGSRELDALLWDLIDDRPRHDLDGSGAAIWKRDPDDEVAFDGPPPFSTSLDAALALVERVLPGWWPSVAQVGPGKWSADIYDPSDKRSLSPAHAPTPPLALVIALVRAKEARDA